MRSETLTIVGVGLIGGSIGLAARRRGMAGHVIGAGRQQASLDRALAAGTIDEASLDLAAAVHRSEIAVFCTPVDRIAEQVVAGGPGRAPGTLRTGPGRTHAALLPHPDALPPARRGL